MVKLMRGCSDREMPLFLSPDLRLSTASAGDRIRAEVITGRGRQRSKIRPAVEAALRRDGVEFAEANPGCVNVVIRKGRYA